MKIVLCITILNSIGFVFNLAILANTLTNTLTNTLNNTTGMVETVKGLTCKSFPEYMGQCSGQFKILNTLHRILCEKNWNENHKFISQHNDKYASGQISYYVSDKCCLAHMDSDTIKAQKCGYNPVLKASSSQIRNTTQTTTQSPEDIKLMSSKCDITKCNKSVDWRYASVVPAVKDQGQCGSCWAFAAMDTVITTDAYNQRKLGKTPKMLQLSAQQLVDCWGSCAGGSYTDAWLYWMYCSGVASQSQYGPYTAADGVCQDTSSMSCTPIENYVLLPQDENCMALHLNTNPCVTMAIDASQQGFQFYAGGIYYDPGCSTTNLDHAVIAIGYGTQSGTNYWIIKNSWGKSWGENGFIRMARGYNQCGCTFSPAYVILP